MAKAIKGTATTLTISDEDQSNEIPLDAKGAVIGRSPKCDVVLKSGRVSREHARVFPDPFGRWIIEDLGSRNGVLVGGERIQARAVLPGETIVIGPFSLTVSQPFDQDIAPDPTVSTTSTFLEADVDMHVLREDSTLDAPLTRASLRTLNHIVDRLAELTSPSELYPDVCRYLAATPDTAVLVVRIPDNGGSSSMSSEILACHVGGESRTTSSTDRQVTNGTRPSKFDKTNIHLSRRVLETVRSSRKPVMARSIRTTDGQSELTITDERKPRVVLCAPVGEVKTSMEVLYLDIPLDRTAADIFDFVQAVARHVRLVRKSLLLLDLKARTRALDHQLSLARTIQSKLTPSEMPNMPGVDVAVYYKPAMWVGGDYCDMWRLPDERFAFAVGDVSGKGLPAAMVMSNLQAALRTATAFCPRPSDAMEHVNHHLRRHLPDNMFVTLFLGVLDPHSGRLEFVNAGHIPPLLVQPGVRAWWLGEPNNPILGVMEDRYTAGTETIAANTGLLAVSDGITEAAASDGEQFGMDRLEKLMRSADVGSARQMTETATKAAARFSGLCPQQDDITVFALYKR